MKIHETHSRKKTPAEVGSELSPYLPGEPFDLLAAYSKRLLEWDDARRAVHRATVYGTAESRRLAALAEQVAADRVHAIRDHGANLLREMQRWARDLGFGEPAGEVDSVRDALAATQGYVTDSMVRLRSDIEEVADFAVSLEKRGAA